MKKVSFFIGWPSYYGEFLWHFQSFVSQDVVGRRSNLLYVGILSLSIVLTDVIISGPIAVNLFTNWNIAAGEYEQENVALSIIRKTCLLMMSYTF